MKVKAGGIKKLHHSSLSQRFFLNLCHWTRQVFLLLADVLCSWLAETHSSGRPQPTCRNMGKEQKKLFLAPIKYELLARRFRHLI